MRFSTLCPFLGEVAVPLEGKDGRIRPKLTGAIEKTTNIVDSCWNFAHDRACC